MLLYLLALRFDTVNAQADSTETEFYLFSESDKRKANCRSRLAELILKQKLIEAENLLDSVHRAWPTEEESILNLEENFVFEFLIGRNDSALSYFDDKNYGKRVNQYHSYYYSKAFEKIYPRLLFSVIRDTNFISKLESVENRDFVLFMQKLIYESHIPWFNRKYTLGGYDLFNATNDHFITNSLAFLKRYPNTRFRKYLERIPYNGPSAIRLGFEWIFLFSWPLGSFSEKVSNGFGAQPNMVFQWNRWSLGFGPTLMSTKFKNNLALAGDSIKKGSRIGLAGLCFLIDYRLSKRISIIGAARTFSSNIDLGKFQNSDKDSSKNFSGGYDISLGFRYGNSIWIQGLLGGNKSWQSPRAFISFVAGYNHLLSNTKGFYFSLGLGLNFFWAKSTTRISKMEMKRLMWKDIPKNLHLVEPKLYRGPKF